MIVTQVYKFLSDVRRDRIWTALSRAILFGFNEYVRDHYFVWNFINRGTTVKIITLIALFLVQLPLGHGVALAKQQQKLEQQLNRIVTGAI